jgi:vitamin B12 transporter
MTGYRQRLHDEIVDNDTFTSTINAPGTSRRAGLEAELGWKLADKVRLSANYAYLHATQPSSSASGQARELRRPKHSGSVVLDGVIGKLTYGASLAYSSAHLDVRDRLPFDVVRLDSYWLAGGRVAYAVTPGVEVFARAANAMNSRYEDISGYRTEGRSLYAGIRLSRR